MVEHFDRFGLLGLPRIIVFEMHPDRWAEAEEILKQLEQVYGYEIVDKIPWWKKAVLKGVAKSVCDVSVKLPDALVRWQKRLWNDVRSVLERERGL
ncbi:unnamed protein product [Amoebophrya sp. A25]|nr:unnamed protein product [Amoebophrya sp. A25]|eukprot:GSA25T00002649001.1